MTSTVAAGRWGGWGVYVVACADGSLYTGITNRLEARLAAHNAGRGARYTRARRPVRLRWWWQCDPQDARRLEGLLKRRSRAEKVKLLSGDGAVLLSLLTEVARRRVEVFDFAGFSSWTSPPEPP